MMAETRRLHTSAEPDDRRQRDLAATEAEVLQELMIAELHEMGAVRSDRVAEVFRQVPRHLFTPGTRLAEAYDARDAVHMKRTEGGVPLSSVSSAQLQAAMLEQADIRVGDSVLEVGSGGANAAMMSSLAGIDGQVTTVDIDADATERARRLLDTAGYERVRVVLADADNGVPEHAPYDRIMVTVGAWDIPEAWIDQLTPGGRLVVPLRMRGLTRSLELERENDHLVSRSAILCGFVAMQGAGAQPEQLVALQGTKAVARFDDGWPGEQAPDLNGILSTPRAEAWTAVTTGGHESFETLQLWLATAFTGFSKLRAEPDLHPVLVDAANKWFDQAVIGHDSVAYLTTRPVEPGIAEFGAHAFGPHGAELAESMANQVRLWDREHRHGPGPRITVWPHTTPTADLPNGLVITKQQRHIAISWPAKVTTSHPAPKS